MHFNAFLVAALFSTAAVATPLKSPTPISPEALEELRDDGLAKRDDSSLTARGGVSRIPPNVLENLRADGLAGRDLGHLEKRDKVLNCGHNYNGKGGHNGNGKWIPVGQFIELAENFFIMYNTKHGKPYRLDFDTCFKAMKAPLGKNAHAKRGDSTLINLAKRDDCYGTKNHDYEGGWYEVNKVGAFGSVIDADI
ncbi:hypothetical protein AJ80_09358 [Polytolypa hystricis UAMH7299]|uniref:Ecp2 effector protein domain-containing protein n=1 Tax=Polytolypa hystricis (strain UAMH7299) TaxID=1447883 RepID=A0A2B7WS07_POLH7|nr:hypothetical protein AJ80_09358 [Polytolypa hystricis UAMH7299]